MEENCQKTLDKNDGKLSETLDKNGLNWRKLSPLILPSV